MKMPFDLITTISAISSFFTIVDKAWNIYKKIDH